MARYSAAATTVSVNPEPPLTLVHTLTTPVFPFLTPAVRLSAGRNGPMGGVALPTWRGGTWQMTATSSSGDAEASITWSTPRVIRYWRPIPPLGSSSPMTWAPSSRALDTSATEKLRITSSKTRTSILDWARRRAVRSMTTSTAIPWLWSRI